jgi:hypothetical protein
MPHLGEGLGSGENPAAFHVATSTPPHRIAEGIIVRRRQPFAGGPGRQRTSAVALSCMRPRR